MINDIIQRYIADKKISNIEAPTYPEQKLLDSFMSIRIRLHDCTTTIRTVTALCVCVSVW